MIKIFHIFRLCLYFSWKRIFVVTFIGRKRPDRKRFTSYTLAFFIYHKQLLEANPTVSERIKKIEKN